MRILVNSSNDLAITRQQANRLSDAVASRLARFAGQLTRAEIHLCKTIRKGREAIRVVLEVRPANGRPWTVSADASRAGSAVGKCAGLVAARMHKARGKARTIARSARPA